MRKQPTQAESLLWRRLRSGQLGVRFRRQHPFAGYIIDFYAPAARLAIELDGAGHIDATQQCNDELREHALCRRGVRVLRFWNPEVVKNIDVVMDVIARSLSSDDGEVRARTQLDDLT